MADFMAMTSLSGTDSLRAEKQSSAVRRRLAQPEFLNLGGTGQARNRDGRDAVAAAEYLSLRQVLITRLVHHVGAFAAKVEVVGFRGDVLEITPPLAVPRPLDVALELSKQAFVVVHGNGKRQ
jgi:hypothetical protein